jgi:hypothetical protein
MSSFVGAIAIADLVKTTLGPKGMDKILQSVRLDDLRMFAVMLLLTNPLFSGVRPQQCENYNHQ